MANEVFISYSREKNEFNVVTEFHKQLQHNLKIRTDSSTTIFIDHQDIQAGEVFEKRIRAVLENAKVMIILLSPIWLNSEWCRKEYRIFATKEGTKTILPVLWVNTSGDDAKGSEARKIWEETKEIDYADWRKLNYMTQGDALMKEVGILADRIKILLK